MRFVFEETSTDSRWLEPDKLSDAAKWGATGFTLLAGLLTFFGIKEGFLDRILRADPTAALWVFLLVGLGVVCALLATAFSPHYRLFLGWLAVATAFLGAVSLILFPNVRSTDVPGLTAGLAVLLALVLLVAGLAGISRRLALPLPAGVLILGIASISLGLYGAAKIAVLSKSASESPRLTAVLEQQEGRATVKVTVSAGHRERSPLVVAVLGRDGQGADGKPGTPTLVGRSVLVGDAVGQVSDTVVFPIQPEKWTQVSVGYCESDDPPDPTWSIGQIFGLGEDPPAADVSGLCTSPDDDAFDERVTLSVGTSSGLQVAAALSSPAAGQLQAAISAAAVPQGMPVQVQVVRERAHARETSSTSLLLPGADGKATTTSPPVPVREGDVVSVLYRACGNGTACDGEWTTVAAATVLPAAAPQHR